MYLALALLVTAFPSSADEIDDLCRERWGTDYVMREFCIKEQREAKSRVLLSQEPSPMAQAERARVLAVSSWLRERSLPLPYDEITALAATNQDAARYIECEHGARPLTDYGTTRYQRLLACLDSGGTPGQQEVLSDTEAIEIWKRSRNVPDAYVDALRAGSRNPAALAYIGCVARAEQEKGGDAELLNCLRLNNIPPIK